ncbi:hypothetical protein ACFE04_010069 [Oxalis oulophora]
MLVVGTEANKRARKKSLIVGSGLYIDPFTGQQIMHPGTTSEHIIAPPRSINRKQSTKSSSQRNMSSEPTLTAPTKSQSQAIAAGSNRSRKGKEKVITEKS